MTAKNNAINMTSGDIVITRIIDAPRELVFSAWTNAKHLENWYAPNGCSIYFKHIDIRVGGTYLSCVNVPNYQDCWCTGEYLEISAPEKIIFTANNADEQGNLLTQDEVSKDPEWPLKTIITVTFEDYEGKTKLTLHQTAPEAVAKRTGAYPSWLQMLDNLEEEVRQKVS